MMEKFKEVYKQMEQTKYWQSQRDMQDKQMDYSVGFNESPGSDTQGINRSSEEQKPEQHRQY
jgi:hypothetical protein